MIIQKYRKLIAIVLNASTCGYEFSDDDIDYINSVLAGIDRQNDLEEVFLMNSCSAKAISTRHMVPDPVFVVQLPNDDVQDGLHFVNRICGGTCSENYCYIDIEIAHKNNRFVLEREMKFHCA